MESIYLTDEEDLKKENFNYTIKQYFYDLLIMVEFAVSRGISVSDEDLNAIQEMNSQITSKNSQDYTPFYPAIVRIYCRLSNLITPVSARSLKATQPKFGWGGLIYHNLAINMITISTISSLILLIILNLNFDFWKNPELLLYLKIFVASILGAGFSILNTIKKYLVNRTYEPRYNQGYFVTFIIGIISGVILSIVFAEIMGKDDLGKFDPSGLPLKIGITVIAIVGGYSAGAVARILERIAETLEAFVRGGIKEQVDNEREKTKAQEQQKIITLIQKTKDQGVKDGSNINELLDDLLRQYFNK